MTMIEIGSDTLKPLDHVALLTKLVPAVLEAGLLQLAVRAAGCKVIQKADTSPVTEADRKSEVILLAALGKAWPGLPCIGEEMASDGIIPEVGREFALIDPLDGTRDYVAGSDEFTVNIGIVRDGSPEFGIIYAPALSELFVTLGPNAAGFARIAADADPEPLLKQGATGFQRIHVRRADQAHKVALVSRSHPSRRVDDYLKTQGVQERRAVGSTLKFCLLARGEADICARLSPTWGWDAASGHAILLAAGGHVYDPDGGQLVYGAVHDPARIPGFVAVGAA